MNYIITNFAYGTGPYLRVSELAIAVNDELEKRGRKRCNIIVPLAYGDKQKKIMAEEFGDFYKTHPEEIIFDEQLGLFLKNIFYGNENYERYLARWLSCIDETSSKINSYLKDTYKDKILLELHRSPRVLYNIAQSYFTSFVYIFEVYEKAIGNKDIAISDDLLKRALPKIKFIEENHKLRFITEPGTFAGKGNIPPTITVKTGRGSAVPSIFVTVTGIPGLDRLYKEAGKLGLKVYSNDTKAVPFAEYALPNIIGSKNVVLQFARSGWSSVWLSMLSNTPLVVPEWDRYDDPEIYFNNICIEKLGIGIVYLGQSLEEILKEAESLKPNIEEYTNSLYKKFGTLDGTKYAARRIVDDFQKTF